MFLKFPYVFLQITMKDKIILKAAELFLNLGFKSVTMDDIAQEMGISKKTIYTHFKNKTELVGAVTFSLFESISEGIENILTMEMDPIEELYEIKKFMMLKLKNEKSSPQYQLQKYYPEIHCTLKEKHFDKMCDCMVQNLERGIAMGLYRDNLDINFVSRIYFNGVHGIKDFNLFPPNDFPRHVLFEAFLEYHLRGIVTKDGLKVLKKFIKTTVNNA